MANDFRSPAEHDCDRILYSSAFRRLAGVTQVVAVDEIQIFHNRLTHTQKVAQLARRLALDFQRDTALEGVLETIGGIDEAVAEAASLAHDIGHPPFGHIAEEVLSGRCDDADADGFEGNAQSFRIVTKLARRANDEIGLGLSSRTLRGILKYPWLRGPEPSDPTDKNAQLRRRKWGAYLSEKAILESVLEEDESAHQSPEAAIMDWCDDISYALHDLEDFFRAGLIPLERIGILTDSNEEAKLFLARASHGLASNPEFDPLHAAAALEKLQGLFPGVPYRGTHEDRRDLHSMTSQLINSYFQSTTVHATPKWVRQTDAVKHGVMLLKQLTWQYVVNSPALATMQEGQKRVVDEVFTMLTDWIKKEQKSGTEHRLPARLRLLSAAFREDQDAMDSLQAEDARCARIVSDYICSLTEAQLLNLFGRLTGRSPNSVLDGWVRW
jgi:dGTPase